MKCLSWLLSGVLASLPLLSSAAELLVLSKRDGTLAFMDPVSGKTHATVATGDGPHELELSKDGRLAFVSNYGAQVPGSSLSVIDVAARKEIKRVDLGELRRPHGLTFANGHVYFTAEQNRRIARYNPDTQKVDWVFETAQDGTHMVLASRDGKKLFTTNMGSNSVSQIDQAANGQWAQTVIKVGAGPEALDLSPDGRTLWTAHSRDGGISIIDIASGKVSGTFDAKTQRSNRLKFTPDGNLVLISDLSGGELVVLDAAQRSERARVKVGKSPTGILIPPDSAHAYVAVSGDNRIAVIDLKSLTVARSISTANDPDGMAWVR